MPNFSDPKYTSYVALCRQLRLERICQQGDKYTGTLGIATFDADRWRRINGTEPRLPHTDRVWLPTFSDWLEWFESLDDPITDIEMVKYSGYALCVFNYNRSEEYKATEFWPTREEAAARAWLFIAETRSLDPSTADDVVKAGSGQ